MQDDDCRRKGREIGPLRRCIVTHQGGKSELMIRFVLSPANVVVVDSNGCLPGRGMWVRAENSILDKAIKCGVFAKVLRKRVYVPDDLLQQIETTLRRGLLDRLSLGFKANRMVCGYAQVQEWVTDGRVGLIIQASDGSADECKRLLSGLGRIPYLIILTAQELGEVFGRKRGVHVAVAPGKLARRMYMEGKRFAGVSPRGTFSSAEKEISVDGV